MYDLNELQAFVSVMKTGSLRKSAHKLGVSKSTLSRRISHLEGAVNQPLLRRQANQLLANEPGIKFLPYAEAILKTALEGQLAIEELKEEVSGSITLYVHDALVRGWFSGLGRTGRRGIPACRAGSRGRPVSPRSHRRPPRPRRPRPHAPGSPGTGPRGRRPTG